MKNFLNSQPEFRLNEILFEGRNKQYGAYVLRNEESAVLLKSLFIGVSLFVAGAVVPLIMSSVKETSVPPTVAALPPEWVIPDELPVVTPPVLVTPQLEKPVKTFDSTTPTPTKNPKVEKPAPTVSHYNDAVAGVRDVEGEPPVHTYTPPVVNPGQVATPPVVSPQPVKDPNAIPVAVDVKASFVGGIDSFRKKVGHNFDTGSFDGSGERITAHVSFIVEKDGTISNVKATGPDVVFNREAEKTVKSVKGKWNPAKLDGELVRSYFKIPITMHFE